MPSVNQLKLLTFIESLLGTSQKKSGNDYAFHCPFCNHYKKKLEVDLNTLQWHCWVCDESGVVKTLAKKLKISESQWAELKNILPTISKTTVDKNEVIVSLPRDFKPLYQFKNDPDFKNAIRYLKSRNFTLQDIYKHTLGYCDTGSYSGMIIFPSYDSNGKLNYFTARSFYEGGFTHKNPAVSKDVVGFDIHINWEFPITLVEGPADAMTVKINTIPLFGKNLLSKLKEKILLTGVDVNIFLDSDALSKSVKIAEELMKYDINVKIIEADGDPNEVGFTECMRLIDNADYLTFEDIVKYKLIA